jgi:hypothetical protein
MTLGDELRHFKEVFVISPKLSFNRVALVPC